MMNYEMFKKELCKMVEDILPESKQLVVRTVNKTNMQQEQISIVSRDKTTTVAPSISLEYLYRKYNMDNATMSQILSELMKISSVAPSFNTADIVTLAGNKDRILSLVLPRFLDRSRNMHLLQECPSREYCGDLQIFYYIPIGAECSMPLTYNVTLNLGISEEELYTAAQKNISNKFVSFRPMQEILRELVGFSSIPVPAEEDPFPMYVLSTDTDVSYGASILLNPDAQNKLNEFGECYLLPSSIHEWIAVPTLVADEISELKEMVMSVNMSEVAVDEQLSDNVFMYKNGHLSCVA